MARLLTLCGLVIAIAPASASAAQFESFSVHGPAVVYADSHRVRVADTSVRVELGRGRGRWRLAVAGVTVKRFDHRPALRIAGGRVVDRQAGSGPVALLGARLLANDLQEWLPGRLARTGAWMRGMPATALWRIGALDRRRARTWWRRALRDTMRLRGGESSDTHDVGLVYESAAYGFDAGCRKPLRRPFTARRCRALRRSALAAADRLAFMVRANAPAPLLPTHLQRCPDCPPGARETIVDSMMNIGLLGWAQRRAGRDGYARIAMDHARGVAGALIRPDGCTAQAILTDVPTGRLFGVHTHQGLSATSTWARGQAWAILGFARLARDTGGAWPRSVAERLVRCWLAKVPDRGIARFDLDSRGGPPDSSAHAVAAAGLATLGRRRAARAELARVEGLVSRVPPLGRLGAQTYVWGGDRSDENVELPIAALYVLESREQLASRP